jgi:hypothetical protein
VLVENDQQTDPHKRAGQDVIRSELKGGVLPNPSEDEQRQADGRLHEQAECRHAGRTLEGVMVDSHACPDI